MTALSRSIFVGDVHGCSVELRQLCDRISLSSGDRLYFVGDLVSRGPDGPGVLDVVRETRARSVVGNHEERWLEARRKSLAGEPGPRLSPSHERLMQALSAADWGLLEKLPLLLEVPEHEILIVHAGLVPGVPVDQQDPWVLTHVRSIREDGTPSDRFGSTPWGALYEGPPHVAFGHNARQAVQLHPWATGLDTGCVYGGRLTAMVLAESARPPPVAERQDVLISVPARQAYVDYGRALP